MFIDLGVPEVCPDPVPQMSSSIVGVGPQDASDWDIPLGKGIFLRGMWRYDDRMSWEECSTNRDASCGSLYFYWRLEALKTDRSNLPIYSQSQPPSMDTKRYVVIHGGGYFPSEQDDESKMVHKYLVRQGYLDLYTGEVVMCSKDDEPWGLTLYSARLVRQGAAGARVSGRFHVMGPNYTPLQNDKGRVLGPGGQWFLVPSQGSVQIMRRIFSAIDTKKDHRRKLLEESKIKHLPTVTSLLKISNLSTYVLAYENLGVSTIDLLAASKNHHQWKTITVAAGMKAGHAARFKYVIREIRLNTKLRTL
ncbi:hypothetical protein AAMO2058_000689100 [Amorphochlora amoebiformis]